MHKHKYLMMLVGVMLCLQSGCVMNTQRGSMLKWRIGWNEHQRPAIICERIEARPPKRERVNYYRWQHSELLTESTPVSYSQLTPDIPLHSGAASPAYVDPFVEQEDGITATTPVDDSFTPPQLPHDLSTIKVPEPNVPQLPPAIWPQGEDDLTPAAPVNPATPDNAPEVIREDDKNSIAQTRRPIFFPASFRK